MGGGINKNKEGEETFKWHYHGREYDLSISIEKEGGEKEKGRG